MKEEEEEEEGEKVHGTHTDVEIVSLAQNTCNFFCNYYCFSYGPMLTFSVEIRST